MPIASDQWPRGGEQGAAAILRHPWGATSLGSMENWPRSLRAAVDFILPLATGAAVLWGPELIVIPNAAFVRLADAGEMLGHSAVRTWPSGWPGGEEVWAAVRHGEAAAVTAEPSKPSLAFSPIRNEAGGVAGILVATSGHGAGSREHLRKDTQHEARNALAWVRSIARRTAVMSKNVDEYLMHLDGRIDAYARARLATAVAPGGVSLASVVDWELLAVAVQQNGRASVEGMEIMLRPKAVESLGLAIHELATNAVKFGALSVNDGHIAVGWHIEPSRGADRLHFQWKESGAPKPVEPACFGFGREVIERSLPYELDATTRIVFEPDGIRCLIAVDLVTVVAA